MTVSIPFSCSASISKVLVYKRLAYPFLYMMKRVCSYDLKHVVQKFNRGWSIFVSEFRLTLGL